MESSRRDETEWESLGTYPADVGEPTPYGEVEWEALALPVGVESTDGRYIEPEAMVGLELQLPEHLISQVSSEFETYATVAGTVRTAEMRPEGVVVQGVLWDIDYRQRQLVNLVRERSARISPGLRDAGLHYEYRDDGVITFHSLGARWNFVLTPADNHAFDEAWFELR